MRHFALIGAPGVGKGTFASIISNKMNLKHISIGDLVRNEIRKETKEGKEFEDYVNTGRLIPDERISQLLFKQINLTNQILLDGFPRSSSSSFSLSFLLFFFFFLTFFFFVVLSHQ